MSGLPPALRERPFPVVGMVHLLPLPGSPRWEGSMAAVLERAREDAGALVEGGVDGVLVENYGDAPFHPRRVPPETVAAMAVAAAEVAGSLPPGMPVGANVLRNDGPSAVAVAVAAGADFIRVNVHTGAMLGDQGWLRGEAHRTLRERARLGARVAILADVLVKHAVAPAGLRPEDAARDCRERGLADALLVSGEATGEPPDPDRVRRVREAAPDAPVWIGSGLGPGNARQLVPLADGAVVGSALAGDGRAGAGIEVARVRKLVEAVEEALAAR